MYCPLTDFDDDDFISRPVSPLLLLTVKTQARWWERTAVSSDERKLQEEREAVNSRTSDNPIKKIQLLFSKHCSTELKGGATT